MKPIEVSFPFQDLHAGGKEVLRNIAVIKKLKDAGIPIVGAISIIGVTSGTLSITTDKDFGEYVFTWTPAADTDPAEGL